MGLRVLITNIELWPPSGTVLYVRDLALELRRQGHTPMVFSSTRGTIADDLRRADIQVSDRLRRFKEPPDIIHGHHRAPTLLAVHHWPTVPAIYICHDHTSPMDETPIHPNIAHYFGVSRVCVQRLIQEGVPASRAEMLLNFVDTARFVPRPPLPHRPRRALVFSNYANEGSHLPAIADACRRAGLELDVAGAGVGRIEVEPERLLGQYDLVFAKAKAAIEAMAVGAAVILCDYGGVGPMVTSAQFDTLRPLNFGFEALSYPLQPEPLLREIARYDPVDAAIVRDLVHARAGLVGAVEGLVGIYRKTIADHERAGSPNWALRGRAAPRLNAVLLNLFWVWRSMSPQRRARIRRIPGYRAILREARKVDRRL